MPQFPLHASQDSSPKFIPHCHPHPPVAHSPLTRMLPAIDAFILHLATERGLSVNYQLLVRRVLESLADWLKTKHQIETPADVTTAHLSDHLEVVEGDKLDQLAGTA